METYPSFPLVIITVNTSCIILGVKFTTCFKLYGVKLPYRDFCLSFSFFKQDHTRGSKTQQ